jgi:hypothetical protein
MKREYEILIPIGLKPSNNEKSAAKVLKNHFKTDVVFLRPSGAYKVRTPDFQIGDIKCELKTPISHKVERVMHAVSHASTQARVIVIDGRKTRITDKRLEEICRAGLSKKVSRIILITKNNNKIVDIKR